jgi:hypothetical protein
VEVGQLRGASPGLGYHKRDVTHVLACAARNMVESARVRIASNADFS